MSDPLNLSITDKLSAARFLAIKKYPYLATALLAMIPIESKECSTMGVDDRWRMYYNPDKISDYEWTVDKISTCYIHEIWHLLRDHHTRAKSYNVDSTTKVIWNFATDAEINDELVEGGLQFPLVPVLPRLLGMPDNLLCEEYYEKLLKDAKQIQKFIEEKLEGKNLDTPGSGGGASGSSGVKEDYEETSMGTGEGNKEDSDQLGEGNTHTSDNNSKIDRSFSGIKPHEAELIRKDVARKIEEYSKNRGIVPGGWARWAKDKLKSKINWRKHLPTLVRNAIANTAGMVDYSYIRPARRQSCCPKIVLPTMRKPKVKVMIQIDTSGSVSDTMLSQATAEIKSVLKSTGVTEVQIFSCDAAMGPVKKIFNVNDIVFTGGGGTDMRIGIKAVEDMKKDMKPNVLIVITDGETPWPDIPPIGFKLVPVILGNYGTAPSFGNHIRIEV